MLLSPVPEQPDFPGHWKRNILFSHLHISLNKAIFPAPASHNCGSRLYGRNNSAYISSLQRSVLLLLLPVQRFPRGRNCLLRFHVPIPALLRLLPQNTIPLPAVSARQGRHGRSRMPKPIGPETDRCPRKKQGIRRTRQFSVLPRRNVSLFSQNTYHLRTAYRRPVPPVWKAVPGKYPGGAVPQKGIVKKTAAWGGHTSTRKNGVQPVRRIYVPAGLTAPL